MTTPKIQTYTKMMNEGKNGNAWKPEHINACGFARGRTVQECAEDLLTEHKCCDVPYCDCDEYITPRFGSNVNIECMKCSKFTCSECCDRIWKGEWDGEEFYKPKILQPGLTHQVWKCPFCRASFDRLLWD